MVKDKQFYKTIFIVAVPAAFQGLISFAMVMFDNLMVGSLGEVVLSGVAVSGSLTALFTTAVTGITGGSMVLISQYWGKKDMEKIKYVFSIVFQFCVGLSIIVIVLIRLFPEGALRIVTNDASIIQGAIPYLTIVCFSYLLFSISNTMVAMLRCIEVVKITLYITIISFVLDLFFSYCLIFGHLGFPPLGAQGAAIATVISRSIELIFVAIYLFKVQKVIDIKPVELIKTKLWMLKDFIRYGIPVTVGDVQWGIISIIKAAVIGRLGIEMVAANSMADVVMNCGMIFTRSLAAGACVVIGKSVGEGDYKKTRKYSNNIQVMYLIAGLIICTVIFTTRGLIPSFYSNISQGTKDLAIQLISIGAFTLIGTSYHASCFIGINRGSGDSRFVFLVDMICGWLVVVPMSLLAAFVWKLPMPLIFLCTRCDQCFKWIIAFIRLRGNKWIRNVTR